MAMAKQDIPIPKSKQKGARYTPVSKRQDRPDAISWLVKNHPELTDAQIAKLIGTTKPTINAIRDRTHWNIANIKPQNPVALGLCLNLDLEKVVTKARAKAGIVHETIKPTVSEIITGKITLPQKPGEVILLKGEAKIERERALELEVDSADIATIEKGATLQDDSILKAEDVFTTPPSKDT